MKKEKIKALVTGAGSTAGQGIVKSLRWCDLPIEIFMADINYLHSGLYRADEYGLIPKVESDDNALEKITTLIRANNIDVAFVGSEFDLEFFARQREVIENDTGAKVIVSPLEAVNISDSKWLTAQFLQDHGLPCPETFKPGSLEEALADGARLGYPLILKPCEGTASRNVHVIENEAQLTRLFASVHDPLLQEMIQRPSRKIEHEYTCSVFKTHDGKVLGPFSTRRTLRAGNSLVIEVKEFPEVREFLLKLGETFDFAASLNVQLMLGPDGPMPFELNCRFSGTTAVRAYYGFNEPEMAIRSYLLQEKLSNPTLRSGVAFRYLEEVFLDNVDVDQLSSTVAKGKVLPWF